MGGRNVCRTVLVNHFSKPFGKVEVSPNSDEARVVGHHLTHEVDTLRKGDLHPTPGTLVQQRHHSDLQQCLQWGLQWDQRQRLQRRLI